MRDENKEIAELLGEEKILHHKVSNSKDLEEVTMQGLPKKSLQRLASYLAEGKSTLDVIYKIVPEGTYKRRQKLSPEVSEKTVRIARLLALGSYILGDQANAVTFLIKEHKLLDGRKPYEVALTEIGARRVEELLWKIFYGIPV